MPFFAVSPADTGASAAAAAAAASGASAATADNGCWDSVLLEQLNEDAFIANLRVRFQCEHIYTAIGTYLVALNPFRPLPAVYGAAQVDAYATRNPFKLPPHM